MRLDLRLDGRQTRATSSPMENYFNLGVTFRIKRYLFALATLLVGGLPEGYAVDLTKDDDGGEPSRSIEERALVAKERSTALADLKRKLVEVKTPEERRASIEEFRSKNEIFLKQQRPAAIEQKSPEIRFAELKEQSKGNPEMLARVEAMEVRLKSVEAIKSKLTDAQVATGEQKQKLLEDVRREQSKLTQVQQQEMQARLEEAKARSVESTKDLPPEMAAIKAKSDARRQELDQLREALTKASPQERVKLLDAWREKRMQERAELPVRTQSVQ